MKSLIIAIALIAFTFVACNDTQAPTATQNSSLSKATIEKNIEFGPFCEQFCEGCCVCYTITAQVVISGNGKTGHVKYHVDGYGVDCETGEPNGSKYTGSLEQNINNLDENAPANGSITVNGSNGGCHFKQHITVNANGDVTVVRASCD